MTAQPLTPEERQMLQAGDVLDPERLTCLLREARARIAELEQELQGFCAELCSGGNVVAAMVTLQQMKKGSIALMDERDLLAARVEMLREAGRILLGKAFDNPPATDDEVRAWAKGRGK
jgi:multidrug resistance efflux pump